MQTWPGTGQQGSATRRHFNRLTAYTLLCFALAGLVAGFTLGGFVQRSASSTTSHIYMIMSSIPDLAVNGMISTVPENIQPGYPIIRSGEDFLSPQKADGRTSYTFSTQIVYNNTSVPIQSHDVTCRLWLTRDPDTTQAALSANDYALPKSLAALNQPLPAEEAGALHFAAPAQQVQPCAANAKTTWTYTISPDMERGTYYLAVLADWKGQHYNWYLVSIQIITNDQSRV